MYVLQTLNAQHLYLQQILTLHTPLSLYFLVDKDGRTKTMRRKATKSKSWVPSLQTQVEFLYGSAKSRLEDHLNRDWTERSNGAKSEKTPHWNMS